MKTDPSGIVARIPTGASPACTPGAEQPTSVPGAEQPTSVPGAEQPARGPGVDQPACAPEPEPQELVPRRESLTRLTDHELLLRIKKLASHERLATAYLIAHLVELEERKLHVHEGFSTLFSYCTTVLRLSEGAAFNRIVATRTARRFPVVLDWLASGAVNLTAVRLLSAHLTEENHLSLLESAFHKSKRQVEELVAGIDPRPDVPGNIRKLPGPRAHALVSEAPEEPPRPDMKPLRTGDGESGRSPGFDSTALPVAGDRPDARETTLPDPGVSGPAGAPGHRDGPAITSPLAPGRYRVQFTADASLHGMIREAQDLLGHRIPRGELAAVFEMALGVLIEKLERERCATTARPRSSSGRGHEPGRRSRYIPAGVRRLVWKRDGGRCAFVGPGGRRCVERKRLEFHHRKPFAMGGPNRSDNIELRCRVHNQYESELLFGPRPITGMKERRS